MFSSISTRIFVTTVASVALTVISVCDFNSQVFIEDGVAPQMPIAVVKVDTSSRTKMENPILVSTKMDNPILSHTKMENPILAPAF